MNEFEKAYGELWSVLHNEPATEIEKKRIENIKLLESLKPLVKCTTPNKPKVHEVFKDDDFVFDENGNLHDSYTCCPNCKKQDIYDSEYDVRFKHCSNCGQAIDWSE